MIHVSNITIAIDSIQLNGLLARPDAPRGTVIFVHGSGSGRLSRRNQYVAAALQDAGFATLLFDLLTADEEAIDRTTGSWRFDVHLLSERLLRVTRWLAATERSLAALPLGFFGASTGAAAALVAATHAEAAGIGRLGAVVSRGGRPDLAGAALADVRVPTLLIVGGEDTVVLGLNRQALAQLSGTKALQVVPGAGHLFEEPGTLEEVAHLAAVWFTWHLNAGGDTR